MLLLLQNIHGLANKFPRKCALAFHGRLSSAALRCIQLKEPIAFILKATANICNVGLMRHTELSEGIDVLDDSGSVVGSSKIAARHVSSTAHQVAAVEVFYDHHCFAKTFSFPTTILSNRRPSDLMMETNEMKFLAAQDVKRVHICLCRPSWRRPSHASYCPCPSSCCPPSSCPTWRGRCTSMLTHSLPLRKNICVDKKKNCDENIYCCRELCLSFSAFS